MKLLRKSFKRLICLVMTFAICCSVMSVTAMATEQNLCYNNTGFDIDAKGGGQGHVTYPTSDEVTISFGGVDYVSYTGTYGLFGSEGVISLRFTNIKTNDFCTYTFICDNNYHSKQSLPKPLAAGTYEITCVNKTVKNFNSISLSFG